MTVFVKTFFYVAILFFSCTATAFAQQAASTAGLAQLVKWQDSLRKRMPVEKLYVQTDKPVYATGDTIWLKAYLFNADYLTYSNRSGLLYVELTNDSLSIIRRIMLPVKYGMAYGNIGLDETAIPEGSYTLRAYTNWMRNFGNDALFTKNIYITGRRPWLVKVKNTLSETDGKQNIYSSLLFTDVAGNPIMLRELQLKATDGDRTLWREKTQTDASGTVNADFTAPAKTNFKNLAIQTQDLRKGEGNKQINIPLVINHPENTYVQFMPEGGTLIAGLPALIGFKAIGEDGLGTDINGKVYNNKQEEVASFMSLHKGIGSFKFTPKSEEEYLAKVTLPGGLVKTYPLPKVKNSGTALHVQADNDAIQLKINLTPDMQKGNTAYVIGQSRGIICYAKAFKGELIPEAGVTILKKQFPTGIARFTLLSATGQALNERIVYINHSDNLKINIAANKKTYTARDSVALQLQVTDSEGKPVQGFFSLSVTDNEQVAADSLKQHNMLTTLLLTSDLKGYVENPGYYAKSQNLQALDNLMLTQGWVGYDWQQVTGFAPPLKYSAEPAFNVKGKVVNVFNKPVAGTQVIISTKNMVPQQGLTDINGQFIFANMPVTDSTQFYVQANNKKGGENGVTISVDDNQPPGFSAPATRYIPWFVNTGTNLQAAENKAVIQQKLLEGHLLKDVEIKSAKIIKNSQNRNGAGHADQILDEKDIKKAGIPTLAGLIEAKVSGLKVDAFRITLHETRQSYMIGRKEVRFLIDGTDLDNFYHNPPGPILPYDRYNYLKSYLAGYPASEISGIEVMYTNGYADTYNVLHLPKATPGDLADIPLAYVEITTRRGVGAFRKESPGTFVYTPLAFAPVKQFYSPRYIVKSMNDLPDVRSTIHWAPNVITDKDGKATVSFYTSDHPSNYTITVEGSDMNGNVGSVTSNILQDK